MTHWLKIRLVALMGGALLIGGAYLHAQDDYGPAAKTPEDAATNFYRLLSVLGQNGYGRSLDEQTSRNLIGSIERSQFNALQSAGRAGEKATQLIADQAFAPQLEAQVQSSSEGKTIVSVAPSTQLKAREVVVIQEDGGYRVDMVATYGRWNNLSGIAADKALYRETDFVSPALNMVPGFVGAGTLAPCFSNLRLLGLGMAQYALDYDEKLPSARKWASHDVLFPYIKEEKLFKCPALSTKGSGYAFNSKLSQLPMTHIHSALQTIQLYETSNPTLGAFAPFTGRAYRHARNEKEGMNICFADGHVRWLAKGTKAQHITTNPAGSTSGFVTISTRR